MYICWYWIEHYGLHNAFVRQRERESIITVHRVTEGSCYTHTYTHTHLLPHPLQESNTRILIFGNSTVFYQNVILPLGFAWS